MNTDNITAAAALGKIAEIRQFSLSEDFGHLANMEHVARINNEVKNATGVDLLNSKNITYEDIERYEKHLDRIIEQSLSHKFSESFLADEVGFLDSIEDFPLHSYRALPITIDALMPFVKQVFKAIGISAPSIMPILKNPIRVQKTSNDELYDFFILSVFESKSKPIAALFHMTLGELNVSSKMYKFSEQFDKSKKIREENELSVIACFLFDGTKINNEAPSNLFLSAIIKYGKDITIGHDTKKFFLKGISSSLLIHKNDEVKFKDDISSSKGFASFAMRETPTGYEYTHLYLIAQDRLMRDISARKLL